MKRAAPTLCTTPALSTGCSDDRSGPRLHNHVRRTVRTPDGVELAVRDFGPQSADHTVVLLHGLCVSDAVWRRQIPYLLSTCDEVVRVVSYDHRGHGRSSDAPKGTYQIDQLASDLAEVLAALEIGGRLTLVGHSMGGMTALAYLARPTSQRPLDPQGLVLIATAAGRLTRQGLGRMLAVPGADALLGLARRLPRSALGSLARPVCWTAGRLWPAHRVMVDAVAAAVADTSLLTALSFLPGLRKYDQRRFLRDIRAQTIILSGADDPITPAVHSRELASAIADAVHINVPHTGHMLPREAPHVVNDAIRRAMFPAIDRRRPAGHHQISMGAMQ